MFRRGIDADYAPGAVEDRHHHDSSVRVFSEKHFIKGLTAEAMKGRLFSGRLLAARGGDLDRDGEVYLSSGGERDHRESRRDVAGYRPDRQRPRTPKFHRRV